MTAAGLDNAKALRHAKLFTNLEIAELLVCAGFACHSPAKSPKRCDIMRRFGPPDAPRGPHGQTIPAALAHVSEETGI